MIAPAQWKKSSFSGGGEGNDCVEIANLHTRVAIRDSKNPDQGALSVPAETFTAFISNLKADSGRGIDGSSVLRAPRARRYYELGDCADPHRRQDPQQSLP